MPTIAGPCKENSENYRFVRQETLFKAHVCAMENKITNEIDMLLKRLLKTYFEFIFDQYVFFIEKR